MATSTDLQAAIREVHHKLGPRKVTSADASFEFEPDWATRLEDRLGHAPWWVISTVIHSVLFLLATLLTVALPAAQTDDAGKRLFGHGNAGLAAVLAGAALQTQVCERALFQIVFSHEAVLLPGRRTRVR